MRQAHAEGDKRLVDYAGDTVGLSSAGFTPAQIFAVVPSLDPVARVWVQLAFA